MRARTILIGCGVIALLAILVVVMAGVITYRTITVKLALQQPSLWLDHQTTGIAVLQLDPDDPWVVGVVEDLAHGAGGEEPGEFLPARVIWTVGGGDGSGYTINFSIEPRGRMLGILADFILWRIGKSGQPGIVRDEHGGEGITSFPGSGLPGHLFAQGNAITWTSDLTTAHRAIDRLAQHGEGPTASSLVDFFPDSSATLYGALSNDDGRMGEALSLVPGDRLIVSPESIERLDGLGFHLETLSADRAAGAFILHFDESTSDARAAEVTAEFLERFRELSVADVSIEAAVSPGSDRRQGTIALEISGLRSLKRTFGGLGEKIRTALESLDSDGTIVFELD